MPAFKKDLTVHRGVKVSYAKDFYRWKSDIGVDDRAKRKKKKKRKGDVEGARNVEKTRR